MYGNYGSWGGLGGFPSRSGAPNSQAVQSDLEFNKGWQDKLAAVPQYVSETSSTSGTPAGASAPSWQTAVANFNAGSDPIAAGTLAIEKALNPLGLTFNRTGDPNQGTSVQYAADLMARPGSSTTTLSVNPEWQRVNNQMQSAMSQRTENQNRQQQAYDFGMLGGNDHNGLLNANYSQPGYGQISGQDQSAAFGADGGTQLGGVNDQFITGAYTPSNSGATYNPNPYSAQNFQPKGWGL